MQEIIEKRKFMREIWREAERSARLDKCFLCGQANIAFCNSHLTPRFILQNISENGSGPSISPEMISTLASMFSNSSPNNNTNNS